MHCKDRFLSHPILNVFGIKLLYKSYYILNVKTDLTLRHPTFAQSLLSAPQVHFSSTTLPGDSRASLLSSRTCPTLDFASEVVDSSVTIETKIENLTKCQVHM